MRDFSNITIGQYYPSASLVHQLDPRLKINLVLLLVVAIFLSSSFLSLFIFTLFLGLVVVLSRIPFKWVLKGIRPVLYIVFFTLVIHFFITPGQTLYKIGFLEISRVGFFNGLFFSFRLILLVFTTSILVFTTTPFELTDGIEFLLKPLEVVKVPAHELAMMMTIALRFIPTLLLETDRLVKAQLARGADFDSRNVFKKIKSFLPIIIPLFVSAFRRANELALAMDARCYRGGKGRTRMRVLKMTGHDWQALGLVILLVVLALALGWLKFGLRWAVS